MYVLFQYTDTHRHTFTVMQHHVACKCNVIDQFWCNWSIVTFQLFYITWNVNVIYCFTSPDKTIKKRTHNNKPKNHDQKRKNHTHKQNKSTFVASDASSYKSNIWSWTSFFFMREKEWRMVVWRWERGSRCYKYYYTHTNTNTLNAHGTNSVRIPSDALMVHFTTQYDYFFLQTRSQTP